METQDPWADDDPSSHQCDANESANGDADKPHLSEPEEGSDTNGGQSPTSESDAAFEQMTQDDAREMDALVREWSGGEDWEENLEHGRAFAQRFGDDAARRLLNDYGLGDHAAIIRAAAKAGRHIANLEREIAELRGETPIAAQSNGSPAPLSDARRGQLDAEHRELRASKDYWTNAQTRQRVRDIMEALHGTRPIPVHGARGDAGEF